MILLLTWCLLQAFGLKDFPMMRPGEFIQMEDDAAGKEVTFQNVYFSMWSHCHMLSRAKYRLD